MYLSLLCDTQEVVPLGLDQLIHVLDLLSRYLHDPNMSAMIKWKRSRKVMKRRVTHMCRSSWGKNGL